MKTIGIVALPVLRCGGRRYEVRQQRLLRFGIADVMLR